MYPQLTTGSQTSVPEPMLVAVAGALWIVPLNTVYVDMVAQPGGFKVDKQNLTVITFGKGLVDISVVDALGLEAYWG